MSTPHQSEEQVPEPQEPEVAEQSAAAGAAPGESEPEGTVAAEAQAAEPDAEGSAPEAADPLEGKTDEEIRGLAAEGSGYLALAQRTRADFDNYRKRTQRDLAAAKVRGGVELARELVNAIDHIELALEHERPAVAGNETAGRVLQALENARGEVLSALERNGITPIAAAGEPFDPTLHEAIARRPAEDGETPGHCVIVYQTGYQAGEEIVRPARVVVAD